MAMNPPIRHIRNGEKPKQEVLNRPAIDLIANLERLKVYKDNATKTLTTDNVVSGVFAPSRIPEATDELYGGVKASRPEDLLSGTDDVRYLTPGQFGIMADPVSVVPGVAIDGKSSVYSYTTETYKITNFSSFSSYSATLSPPGGNAYLVDDDLFVNFPHVSTPQAATLTITKDGVPSVYSIDVVPSTVKKPTITAPANGSNNVANYATFSANAFDSIPSGVDTHASTDWQVATDSGFTNIVAQSLNDTVNLTSWTVDPRLDPDTQYYVRVRYRGSVIGASAWSNTISFVTVKAPNKPTISSPSNGSIDIPGYFQITSSAFSSLVSGDSHGSSTWIIEDSLGSVVFSSVDDSTNLTDIFIPYGTLEADTTYFIKVAHKSALTGNISLFSNPVEIKTAEELLEFVPGEAGTPLAGGYYAGGNILIGDEVYAVVVAPVSQGGLGSAREFSTRTSVSSYVATNSTVNDGWFNTQLVISEYGNLDDFPAMKYCSELSIGGFTDWYLPSKDETEVIYRHLKPSDDPNHTGSGANSSSVPPTGNYTTNDPVKTTNPNFMVGGSEAITPDGNRDGVWTSTFQNTSQVWRQIFLANTFSSEAGYQVPASGGTNIDNNTHYCPIAIRRVRIA